MKTSWDEVMRYAPSGSYRPEAEACDTEKIRATTMKKLGLPARETRGLPRPARLGLLAAAIAVLLCCTTVILCLQFTIFIRCLPDILLENAVEMLGILIPQFIRNLADGLV